MHLQYSNLTSGTHSYNLFTGNSDLKKKTLDK